MIDLSKQKVKINCPSCNKTLDVTLAQVSKEALIKCSGCNSDIELKDSNNSVKSGIKNVNKALKDLEKTFKKLGK